MRSTAGRPAEGADTVDRTTETLELLAAFVERRRARVQPAPTAKLEPGRRWWPWSIVALAVALGAGVWAPQADLRLLAGYVSLAATGALAAAALATGVIHRDSRTPDRISQAVALLSLAFASSLTAALLHADEVAGAEYRQAALVLAGVAAAYDLGPNPRWRGVLMTATGVAGAASMVLRGDLAVPDLAAPLAVGVVVAASWRARSRGAIVMAVAIGGGELLLVLGGGPIEWALVRQGALALVAGLWVLLALVDSYRRMVVAREECRRRTGAPAPSRGGRW